MEKLREAFPYLALSLPTGVALFFYGYLGSFTRFIADDYCSAAYAQELGLVKSILYWYRTWSGRYSAFGMDWLVLTKLLGRYSIQLVPPITLGMWLIFAFATIHFYLKSIAPERNNLFSALVLAACSVYLILVLSPNIPQSLYWWNGMRSYTLPLVLLTGYTFFFQLIAKQFRTTQQLILGGILSFFLLFASGGLSETYVVLQLLLLGFLLLLKGMPWPRKRIDPGLILLGAGFLGTILSLLVIVSAPGNEIRQSRLDSSFDLMNLFSISLPGYTNFLFDMFSQPIKLSALLGVIALTLWTGMQYKRAIMQPWKIFAFFIGGLALSFACILPGAYGYSQMPPPRTMILPVFVFVVFLLVGSFFVGGWLSKKMDLRAGSKSGLIIIASALVLFSTLSTSQSLYESRDAYIAHAEKWDAVDAQILQAKAEGKQSVEIPDMTNWSGLDRPIQDAGFWLNECYTSLYGIEIYGPPFLWQ